MRPGIVGDGFRGAILREGTIKGTIEPHYSCSALAL